jgi:hypothetical protein
VITTDAFLAASWEYRITGNGNLSKGQVMANQHKIVVWVKPKRRSVDIKMSAHGNILRLNLAGYGTEVTNAPIPDTSTDKAYLTAVLTEVIDALT